jgi:hypothetical protein
MEKIMPSRQVPNSLKIWFIIHFLADVAFAIPLFLFPQAFLGLLKWHSPDPFSTRLVAAALFGIGIESFLGRDASPETYKHMLNLKIIWSAAGALGILITIIQSNDLTPAFGWLLLYIFITFHILWVYYRIRVGKILAQ